MSFKAELVFVTWWWSNRRSSPPCYRSTLQVIRTMACEYALCSLFVPGDRQIILGTKVFGHTHTNRHWFMVEVCQIFEL